MENECEYVIRLFTTIKPMFNLFHTKKNVIRNFFTLCRFFFNQIYCALKSEIMCKKQKQNCKIESKVFSKIFDWFLWISTPKWQISRLINSDFIIAMANFPAILFAKYSIFK